MDILISGGSGFLGSALSQWLYEKQGGEVSITWLSRDNTQSHPSYINMMSYEELSETPLSFDVVLNLAVLALPINGGVKPVSANCLTVEYNPRSQFWTI